MQITVSQSQSWRKGSVSCLSPGKFFWLNLSFLVNWICCFQATANELYTIKFGWARRGEAPSRWPPPRDYLSWSVGPSTSYQQHPLFTCHPLTSAPQIPSCVLPRRGLTWTGWCSCGNVGRPLSGRGGLSSRLWAAFPHIWSPSWSGSRGWSWTLELDCWLVRNNHSKKQNKKPYLNWRAVSWCPVFSSWRKTNRWWVLTCIQNGVKDDLPRSPFGLTSLCIFTSFLPGQLFRVHSPSSHLSCGGQELTALGFSHKTVSPLSITNASITRSWVRALSSCGWTPFASQGTKSCCLFFQNTHSLN